MSGLARGRGRAPLHEFLALARTHFSNYVRPLDKVNLIIHVCSSHYALIMHGRPLAAFGFARHRSPPSVGLELIRRIAIRCSSSGLFTYWRNAFHFEHGGPPNGADHRSYFAIETGYPWNLLRFADGPPEVKLVRSSIRQETFFLANPKRNLKNCR